MRSHFAQNLSGFISGFIATSILAGVAGADTPLSADSIESMRVHQVVESMEEAARQVDVGAYMSLVDPDDTFFVTEQRAWISDLEQHPVENIQIQIDDHEAVLLQDDGSVIAPLSMTWRIPEEHADRHFSYQARFEPIGSVDGQWVFVGRAWGFSDTAIPGIRVYAEEEFEDLAYLCADRAAILRETIADNFQKSSNPQNAQEIVVKIYPDMESLQASIFLSYTDPLSGWNEPGESIKILGREEYDQKSLDLLLGHEIGHAISFEFGPKLVEAPWWTLEGLAEVAAQLFQPSWDRRTHRVSNLAKDNNLRDWELLADFRGEASNHAMHVYLQGWSMIDYISRVYQLPARNEWFKHLGAGLSVDEASQLALGVSFDDLDKEWRAWLLNWKPSPLYQSQLDEEKRLRELKKQSKDD